MSTPLPPFLFFFVRILVKECYLLYLSPFLTDSCFRSYNSSTSVPFLSDSCKFNVAWLFPECLHKQCYTAIIQGQFCYVSFLTWQSVLKEVERVGSHQELIQTRKQISHFPNKMLQSSKFLLICYDELMLLKNSSKYASVTRHLCV